MLRGNEMLANTFLEDIESIVSARNNHDLINLSDWNPSNKFIQSVNAILHTSFIQNGIDYIFSSEINDEIKNKVKFKFGFGENKSLELSFFDSGSLSIVNVIHLLSKIGIHDITIISPSYFSVEHICKDYAINCRHVELEKQGPSFILPNNYDKILKNCQCIWLTNPVYCTGTYWEENFINNLNDLIEGTDTLLVIDESLSEIHRLISPKISSRRCITITSPHKALCTNGIKFSVILFPSQYSQIIDTWSDILTGCLSLSALTAIHHFISADYDDYLLCVKKIVEHNKQAVLKILKKYKIQYDTLSNSYLLSIYFLNLPYNYFDEKTNIIKFIDSTAAYVIPNSRNHFPKSTGLSFRLNLCSVSEKYLYALERAIIYLGNLK